MNVSGQLYANTYGGVYADNSFSNANVLAAADSGGALQAVGHCYHGAGAVFFTEYLSNSMRNSDGITLSNLATKDYGPRFPCNATPGFGASHTRKLPPHSWIRSNPMSRCIP